MSKPLASMTGYARASGQAEGCTFNIDLKSVNSRGLDLRLRLPPGFDALEPVLRALIAEKLTRGAVNLNLNVQRESRAAQLSLNEEALEAVLAAIDKLSNRIDAQKPSIETILSLKGVLDTSDAPLDEGAESRLHEAILVAVRTCLDDLIAARQSEGASLKTIVSAQIDEIERLTAAAEVHPSRSREAILQKLKDQIASLLETGTGLSEERLNQEALLLATKADIREELDRLTAHVAASRQLLAAGGAIGRKLDFMAQEFNREANTLCSKSNAVDLTAIGLDLKAVIDQYREQIQNLE